MDDLRTAQDRRSRQGRRAVRATAAWAPGDGRALTWGAVQLGCGAGILAGLLGLSLSVRLDTVLVLSRAIYQLINGLHGIGNGLALVLLGLGQMLSFLGLAGLALVAMVAMASSLNDLIRLITLPLAPRARAASSTDSPSRPRERRLRSRGRGGSRQAA